MLGLGLSIPEIATRGAAAAPAPPAAAWEQIYNLAVADGWYALFDANNPNTLTLSEGGTVAAIADALGHWPDAVQETGGAQPIIYPGEFGQLDGIGNKSGADRFLVTAAHAKGQPISVMAVGRLYEDSQVNRALWGGRDSTSQLRLMRTFNQNTMSLFGSAASFVLGSFNPNNQAAAVYTVTSVVGENASKAWVNGAQVAVGTMNAGVNGFVLLDRGSGGTSPWFGTAGPWLVYDGEVPDEKRIRMSDLLHTLTGIAKAS